LKISVFTSEKLIIVLSIPATKMVFF